jgi:hypothetical protein
MPATQALHSNTLHAAYVGIEWRRDNLHARWRSVVGYGMDKAVIAEHLTLAERRRTTDH